MASELPKKISENDSPTTAAMPHRRSPCGACSRDDPQPKLRLTARIDAPAKRGSSNGWTPPCRAAAAPIVLEHVRSRSLEADRLQESGPADPVGVDVLPATGTTVPSRRTMRVIGAVGTDTPSL